jgi:hypothetical protein
VALVAGVVAQADVRHAADGRGVHPVASGVGGVRHNDLVAPPAGAVAAGDDGAEAPGGGVVDPAEVEDHHLAADDQHLDPAALVRGLGEHVGHDDLARPLARPRRRHRPDEWAGRLAHLARARVAAAADGPGGGRGLWPRPARRPAARDLRPAPARSGARRERHVRLKQPAVADG